jgi:hypothetical protein
VRKKIATTTTTITTNSTKTRSADYSESNK